MLKTHIIVDFYDAKAEIFAHSEPLKKAIVKALSSLNLTIKQESFIQFEPQGVTATIVAEDFHFSIHTWPEHGSCAIDLFSCRDHDFTRTIATALKTSFEAKEYDLKVLNRSR